MSEISLSLSLIVLCFGVAFGFLVQKAGFCISFGLGEIFSGKGKRFLRMILAVIIISTIGFSLSGLYSQDLGIKPIGQLRGYGFYNLLSGFFFGAGITVAGGCILGTLRQIGEGNLHFIVVLLSFIPGMYLVVNVLNPILEDKYFVKKLTLVDITGINGIYLSLSLALICFIAWLMVQARKKKQK